VNIFRAQLRDAYYGPPDPVVFGWPYPPPPEPEGSYPSPVTGTCRRCGVQWGGSARDCWCCAAGVTGG
jgi:hypothetical protein